MNPALKGVWGHAPNKLNTTTSSPEGLRVVWCKCVTQSVAHLHCLHGETPQRSNIHPPRHHTTLCGKRQTNQTTSIVHTMRWSKT